MKIRSVVGMVAMAAVATASGYAGGGAAGQRRVLVVCVRSGNALQAANTAAAQASKIFAEIGVQVAWHVGWSCPVSKSMIQVSFSEETPAAQLPGAWAYALPYEGTHIVVFYDRINRTTRNDGAQQLLAYVMVHEITHILQGVNRHSATGIMKAQWSPEDYFEMGRKRLGFTPGDTDLIYQGLDARATRQVGAALIVPR
jgi:hypothetical protein